MSMANTNFYEELDLRYPEIAIAIDRIDRVNPGKVRFIIPILTPDLDTSKAVHQKKVQTPSNLVNENKSSVSVDTIEITNYIEISVPKMVVALVDGEYNMTGDVNCNGNGQVQYSGTMNYSSSGNHNGSGSIQGSISGHGTIGPPQFYDQLSAEGTVSGESAFSGNYNQSGNISGSMSSNGNGRYLVQGTVHLTPTDKDRYIEAGSKWIVVFIGGDIDKPMIIAPYTGK